MSKFLKGPLNISGGLIMSVPAPSIDNIDLLADTKGVPTANLLGRTTAGTGAAEAIAVGAGLSLTGLTLSSTATGTVTSVAATAPAAGLTISGSPITGAGTFTFALANDLAALEGLSTTGYAKRTGTDAWSLLTAIPVADVSGLGSLAFQSGTFSGTHSGTSSGTNTGDQTLPTTLPPNGSAGGDLAGSTYPNPVIAANAVTLAKMAQIATSTFLGRITAATGTVEALTVAQAKTLLSITGTNSGDAALAGENYLSIAGQVVTAAAVNLSGTNATGTLAAGRFPALTGDVTTVAGALSATISAGAITLAKQANLAANSFVGNNTGVAATPIALTATQAKALLAIASTDVSGLGTLATASAVSLTTQATGALQAAQFPALTGDATTTAGSLAVTLAASGVTAGTYGSSTLIPVPVIDSKGRITSISTVAVAGGGSTTLTGDVTGTGTGTFATTIANNAVTSSKFRQSNALSVVGNPFGGVSNVADITAGADFQVLRRSGTSVSFGAIDLSQSATVTGTLISSSFPALTGDVTTTAGAVATTIAANAVTLSKMATVLTATFLGRVTAATGTVEALTVAQAKVLLNLTGTNSGDATIGGENYLSIAGQVVTASAVNLSGTNATGTLAAGRFPALTGDATTTAGSLAVTLAASGVTAATYGSAALVPVLTVDAKGRITSATTAALPQGSASYVMASTFTMTGANGVYQAVADSAGNVGIGVTAGTWEITMQVRGLVQAASGSVGNITARLVTATSVLVPGSEIIVAVGYSTNTCQATATVSVIVTTAVSTTYYISAMRDNATTWAMSTINSDANGRTRLTARQIS